MKRKFSLGLMVGVFALIFPLCVKADQFSVTTECKKSDGSNCSISNGITEIGAGERVTLAFNISSTGAAPQSFSGTVTLGDKLAGITNFNPNNSYWADLSQVAGNNGYEGGNIGLAQKLTGATGDPKFSFDITAGNVTGETSVTISSISLLYDNDGTSKSSTLEDLVLPFNIVQSASNSGETNTGTDDNTNQGTNTNDNTNTNTDAKTDASETKKETPKNPDTGVTLSALGIALLVFGGISYIALRKKNYFNRI